jgi:hypothetical protein
MKQPKVANMLPLWWLFGFPFGGAFFLVSGASLPLFVGMVVVLAVMGLMAAPRSTIRYVGDGSVHGSYYTDCRQLDAQSATRVTRVLSKGRKVPI